MPENESPQGNAGWTPEPVQQEEPRTPTSRIVEIFLWVALVGIVAAVAIPEFAGRPIEDKNILGTLFGFLGLPFIIARMRRARAPWLYSLAGLGLFIALPMAGGAMRGLEKREHGNDLLTAIEQFEPDTGKRARAAEKNPELLRSILLPAIRRAAQRAPDAELVAYNKAIFRLVETPTGIDRQRCAATVMGERQRPTTSAEEIYLAKATAQLFRAALPHPEPISFDRERSIALRGEIVRAADVDGVTTDPVRLAALTRDQHCDLYLRMMKNLRELPVADVQPMECSREM